MTTPEITAAITTARYVYESVPVAGQVLNYLEAVLAADAESRAADEWRERALKAEAALAAREASEFMTGTGHGPAPAGFVRTALDKAAANMAAESAQMLADAERMVARAGHVGVPDQLQTRIDAAVGGGLLDDIKEFIEEANASAAAWAAPAPSTVISTLVVEIDASAIDAALAKVEQLKVALASVAPAMD